MTSDGTGASKRIPSRGGRASNPQAIPGNGLGPALGVDAAALDHVAQVTLVDVAAARAVWRESAPAPLRDLLDAEPQEGE